MSLFTPRERVFAEAVSSLVNANPFLPERIVGERKALGDDFVEVEPVWSLREDGDVDTPNTRLILKRVEVLARTLLARLDAGSRLDPTEASAYEDLVLYLLYYRHEPPFRPLLRGDRPGGARRLPYRDFAADLEAHLSVTGLHRATLARPDHVYACLFQVRRAFHHIFTCIVGGSMPAARLRAAVWQSIFTHDMRRHRQDLHARMGDVTTLIVGPSGTGKELVARAIALSRYVPFDGGSQTFGPGLAGSFHTLNLSALSPTLIESELFGHRRGAFTGALEDRVGWLEVCPPQGTVFLDEVGEIDGAIQVKLLRVLQGRTFQRLGETATRRFEGKVIAATNRDLARAMEEGRFRRDFYYRLCSDLVRTPSLSEQVEDSPAELDRLVLFVSRWIAGEQAAAGLASEVRAWIDRHLGRDYGWPGNVRELEQCVRNVMIRREYRPLSARPDGGADTLVEALGKSRLTADQLLRIQCTVAYVRTGSYIEAARQLGLDRRTVKAKLDGGLLTRLRPGAPV